MHQSQMIMMYVCEVTGKLWNMSTADMSKDDVSVCANCGKEGNSNEISNMCNKCKQVKYCNAACKKKQRHKHKKDCEEHVRLAAQRAAELHDEELFKQPPLKNEDCPICFQRMPSLNTGYRYYSCCGKVICGGCVYAPVYDDQGNTMNEACPFCRTPPPILEEEDIERIKKRMEVGDARAIYNIGIYYRDGRHRFPQDHAKALKLWNRAAELGCSEPYCNIAGVYEKGRSMEVDKEKAKRYFELGAIGGDEMARHNLGIIELRAGKCDRALKHFMIAVRNGYTRSMEVMRKLYSHGNVTKEDYTEALRLYQEYLGEIKSDQRDKAAAADEEFRYY